MKQIEIKPTMKKTLKTAFGLITLILLLSNKNNISYEPPPLIVCFEKGSFHLNANTITITDSIIKQVNVFKHYIDSIKDFRRVVILLIPYSTKNEYIKNKYIGVQRALEIIDYCEKKHGIKRAEFKILDKYKYNDGYGSVCSGVEIKAEIE